MVAFIHDQIIKICRGEFFQILGDALHRCKNDRLGHILLASGVLSQACFRPDLGESLFCLRCQLQGVDQKQRASAHCLGIRCCCDSFTYAGCVVQQRDGFTILTHLLQVVDSLLLVIPQLYCLPHLNRKICFKSLEHGTAAQKGNQLILNLFRLFFKLAVNPTIYFPVVIDQTVLLQEIIRILVLRHLAWVMVGFAVYLNRNFGFRRFQRKIDITVPTINVHAGVLNLQIFGLFRAKSLTEQLHKQLLRTAVDTGRF